MIAVLRLSQRLDQVNLLPGSHKTTAENRTQQYRTRGNGLNVINMVVLKNREYYLTCKKLFLDTGAIQRVLHKKQNKIK